MNKWKAKKAQEKQSETLKHKQKMPFLKGETRFFYSEAKKEETKKIKTNKKTKQTPKKTKKKNTKKREKKNTKIPKNELFNYQSIFSKNFVGVQKFPFLTTWPKKCARINTIKIEVSAKHFLKNRCASRNGHFWTKNTTFRKFQFCFFLLLQQQKDPIVC